MVKENMMENLCHVRLYNMRNDTNKIIRRDSPTETENERLLSERKRVQVSLVIYRTYSKLISPIKTATTVLPRKNEEA